MGERIEMTEIKLNGGKTVKVFEVKMNEVLSALNDVQDGNEEMIVKMALPMLCDATLDELIALPVSEIEKIIDGVKRKNKSFINVCNCMRQQAWLNQILTVFSAAVMKVLSDNYFPNLVKQAREAVEKNAG